MLGAAELFLASSLREVQGVASLDGLDVTTCPGPVTQRVAGLLAERIQAELSGAVAPRGRMNLDLTDEQRLIRETAREFADREIVPRARENDRTERFDLELVKQASREMGYLGAPVAEEYGGRGLDYVSYGLIVEEIGRGDSSARTVVSVQTSLVAGLHRAVGHRGAKARDPAEALLGRVARLLRADRARHRLGRRIGRHARDPAATAAGRSPARRCSSRSATTRRSR